MSSHRRPSVASVAVVLGVGATLALLPVAPSAAVSSRAPDEAPGVILSSVVFPADDESPDLTQTVPPEVVLADLEETTPPLLAAPTSGLHPAQLRTAAVPDQECLSQASIRTYYLTSPQGFPIDFPIGFWGKKDDRTVSLEIQGPDGWVAVATGTMPAQDPSSDWFLLTLTLPATFAQGDVRYRATLAPSANCPTASSEEYTVTFMPAQHRWSNNAWMLGSTDGKISRGVKATLELKSAARLSKHSRAPADLATTFVVERRDGNGAWKTMPKIAAKANTDADGLISLSAKIPPFSKSNKSKGGKVTYRFSPVATEAIESVPGPELTVNYFNARKVAIKAVKRVCKKTPVTFVKKPAKGAEVPPGSFVAGYVRAGTNRVYLVSPRIEKAMSLDGVKQVGYHECGHVLQYSVYAKGLNYFRGGYQRYQEMVKDAKAIFSKKRGRSSAVEHMADCVAEKVSGLTSQQTSTGYGGTCSKKQLKAAQRLIKGKRIR